MNDNDAKKKKKTKSKKDETVTKKITEVSEFKKIDLKEEVPIKVTDNVQSVEEPRRTSTPLNNPQPITKKIQWKDHEIIYVKQPSIQNSTLGHLPPIFNIKMEPDGIDTRKSFTKVFPETDNKFSSDLERNQTKAKRIKQMKLFGCVLAVNLIIAIAIVVIIVTVLGKY